MKKHFTTSVFIVDKKDNQWKILLIWHRKFDKWMVPGGHIEDNENPIESAIREAKEETGLDVEIFSLKNKIFKVNDAKSLLAPEFFYEQIIPQSSKDEEHCHLDFAYYAKPLNSSIVLNNKETKDLQWFSLEEAIKLNLFEGTKLIIKNMLNYF